MTPDEISAAGAVLAFDLVCYSSEPGMVTEMVQHVAETRGDDAGHILAAALLHMTIEIAGPAVARLPESPE